MSKHKEDLDFEITFYENLLKKHPRFSDAMTALGDAYSKKGRYEDGLKVDKQLEQLKPDDPVVCYNLACDYSLLHDAERSLEYLKKALYLGYDEFDSMEQDSDLDFIRQDPRYKELVSKHST